MPSQRLVTRLADPCNAGTPLDLLARTPLTPVDCFYVRNHGPVPQLDPLTYRLAVDGLVRRPSSSGLSDLHARFERHELVATLHCAGNRRGELSRLRQTSSPLQWGVDAVGTAAWSGLRLADLIGWADPHPGARHVCLEGADEVTTAGGLVRFGASIPLDKALGGEVLLADRMNGERLPPEHGGPLRLVVPGYIGARSVKWLTRITLSAEASDNWFQARDYRRNGQSLAALELNSAIAEPAEGASVTPGPLIVRGYALAGPGRTVERVEISGDGGRTWSRASLVSDNASPWSWRLWEAQVDLEPGEHELAVRAWDDAGGTQPADLASIWNEAGYMNNAWHRMRVTVRP